MPPLENVQIDRTMRVLVRLSQQFKLTVNIYLRLLVLRSACIG